MTQNDRTNRLIMWIVTFCDFELLNIIILFFSKVNADMMAIDNKTQQNLFVIICNLALLVSESKFHTIIHERIVSAGNVLRSVLFLALAQVVIAYIAMRHLLFDIAVGRLLLEIGALFFILLLVLRLIERNTIKWLRRLGRNTRTITFVGSDTELCRVYDQLLENPTTGYQMQGYYAEENLDCGRAKWMGTISGLVTDIMKGKDIQFGDELYVCISRRESRTIRLLAKECDRQLTRFYYVPLSVESIGLEFQREYVNDLEIYTTHESILKQPVNQFYKRFGDIVGAMVGLALTGLVLPIVYFVVKKQSPGPLFFKQMRTGLDGKPFMIYKFRSMHVNNEADRLQATKHDVRKFPFGSLMRKLNIDELPQLWNVLKGDMSIVGPRPHMLMHTEMYSDLIDKYMVRHFVKPGVTGWAQVTGFRGETKELWQMEERVKRDIWYMEHWNIWLDIRIIWLTIKNIIVHDEFAY